MKNYCCFVTFSSREGAENAMANLFNKLMIKGQKYKLMWGRVQNESNKDNEEELERIEKNNIQYKTECPLFEPNNYNPKSIVDSGTKKQVYPVSLNIFDLENKPYYPSMDPNALGGLLRKNKNVKSKEELINCNKNEETN